MGVKNFKIFLIFKIKCRIRIELNSESKPKLILCLGLGVPPKTHTQYIIFLTECMLVWRNYFEQPG